MRPLPRIVAGSCSVAVVLLVVATAAVLGPDGARSWLLVSGGVAVIAAIQAVTSDPADLAPALLFSLPPVIALLADGSPTWLIGPLGALLLLAGELSALSWDLTGTKPMSTLRRQRLRSMGQLTVLALAASLLVTIVGRAPSPRGTVAALLAATALTAFGGVVFRRTP